MIKNITSILMLFIAILDTKGQAQNYNYIPISDSNVIWSEIYYPPITYGEITFERFALSGEDTSINTVSYKKLYLFFDTVFNKSNALYIGGIREESNKKVYYKGSTVHFLKPSYTQIINNGGNENDEIMLYDFSLNVGDTFSNGNLTKPDDYLVVTKIDTLLFNNSYRKVFHFYPIWWVQWIEGIGSSKGLLFTSGDLPTNGIDNDLICFKRNDSVFYFNNSYTDCIPLITNIDDNRNPTSGIKVFPNPSVNHSITFVFSDITNTTLNIFDCQGVIRDKIELNHQSELTINIEHYPPGIYFFKVFNIYGASSTGKFIVY